MAAPKMKPRDSMPQTAPTCCPRHGSHRASMHAPKAWASASNGVMSLNMMPGRGKSGTSRTRSKMACMGILEGDADGSGREGNRVEVVVGGRRGTRLGQLGIDDADDTLGRLGRRVRNHHGKEIACRQLPH